VEFIVEKYVAKTGLTAPSGRRAPLRG